MPTARVIHVVENEGVGGDCAPSNSGEVAGNSIISTNWRTGVACLESAEGDGFPGAGRVQIARSFALSSILSRRKSKGHEAPRSIAIPEIPGTMAQR
jgi:hypothetical protein